MAEQSDIDGYYMEIAAMKGNCSEIRRLYTKNHRTANYCGEWDSTPLMRAAEKGHNEAVHVLITECQAEVDSRGKYGHSALHLAASSGYTGIVKELIHHGANINAVDLMDRTPLMMASGNGHLETVKTLVSHDAEIDRKNKEDETAKCMAHKHGRESVHQFFENIERDSKNFKNICVCQCNQLRNDLENLSKKVDSMSIDIDGMKRAMKDNDKINSSRNKTRPFSVESDEIGPRSRQTSITSLDSEEGAMGGRMNFSRQSSKSSDVWDSRDISQRVFGRIARKLGASDLELGIELGIHKHRISEGKTHYETSLDILVMWQNGLPKDTTKEEKIEELKDALQNIERNDLVNELEKYL